MKSYTIKVISISIAVIVSLVFFSSLGLGLWAMVSGMSASTLESKDGELIISGMYGESIPFSEIKSIELIDKKPQISRRTNGFALGEKKKGYFANPKGEKFKLFIDSPELPWILITKQNERKIYYSSSNSDNKEIFEDLITTLPNNAYKTKLCLVNLPASRQVPSDKFHGACHLSFEIYPPKANRSRPLCLSIVGSPQNKVIYITP